MTFFEKTDKELQEGVSELSKVLFLKKMIVPKNYLNSFAFVIEIGKPLFHNSLVLAHTMFDRPNY